MITTLGFTTRDRPQYLERCVRSFVQHCRRFERRPRLLVMDDAEPGRHASARSVTEKLARENPDFEVLYAGLAERQAFVAALAGAGISAEAAEFALLNPEEHSYQLGANRNALQLATLGEQVLFIDDDCLAETSRPPEWTDTLAVIGPGSTTQEYWYYPDYDSARAAAVAEDIDLLGQHELFLGRRCEDVMTEAPDHLARAGGWTEVMRTGSTVKLTQNGVLGDSCMYSNIGHLLHGSPRTRARLSATPAVLGWAMESREIIRSASHRTLRLGGLLIGPDFGCDHSTPLPPFFPVFRSSDTTFADLLSLAYPQHAMADLPWLITHSSLPGRRYSGRGVSQKWRVSASELIRGLLLAETPSAYRSVSNPLLSIGERMIDFGSRPAAEFSSVVAELVDGLIARKTERLTWLLDNATDAAPHYTQALRRSLRLLADSAREPQSASPVELSVGVTAAVALARLQRLALRFGQLLQCWRDIDEATRRLAAAGVQLARPV